MNSFRRIIPLLFVVLFLTACSNLDQKEAVGILQKNGGDEDGDLVVYNQESWKTVIPSTCRSFNDGCNNCRKMGNEEAACTRMLCEQYEKPKCLDGEAGDKPKEAKEDEEVDQVVCTADYAPVCARVDVQCIKAPCDPVKKTFSNRCNAGIAKAIDIIDGACEDSGQ